MTGQIAGSKASPVYAKMGNNFIIGVHELLALL